MSQPSRDHKRFLIVFTRGFMSNLTIMTPVAKPIRYGEILTQGLSYNTSKSVASGVRWSIIQTMEIQLAMAVDTRSTQARGVMVPMRMRKAGERQKNWKSLARYQDQGAHISDSGQKLLMLRMFRHQYLTQLLGFSTGHYFKK